MLIVFGNVPQENGSKLINELLKQIEIPDSPRKL